MLVLTRKEGEFLLLGKDIEVRVLRVDGDQIRLGIVAPRSVNIVRGELLNEIREETALSAKPAHDSLENLARLLKGATSAQPAALGTKASPEPVVKSN